MKILDCTLRDGGYYTNWDFSASVVDSYIKAMNLLPIDYLEVGYRNNPTDDYLGKFGYTPISVLKHIHDICSKKLVVMLNEKSTKIADLHALLKPLVGLVDMIRIAIDPQNFERALDLAKAVKNYGFEVGFNTMYMSKWGEYDGFITKLNKLDDVADLFCMVDSFGGVTPDDVRSIFTKVKENTTCPIGFHGHNNLQLGLINTLTAINCGVDFVDATILGMGRGAGNVNMELLLTFLNKKGLEVDFNVLGDVITAFQPLYENYRWGTNLPYMISGASSIPQKEVMEWVTNRTYSFNSIVRALDNKKKHIKDNANYPILQKKRYSKVLVIGGGNTCIEHLDAIKEYARMNADMPLIFVTARHATNFLDLSNPKYYCLVGNEAKRLEKNVPSDNFSDTCVLAPYPRTMGTEVPKFAEEHTFELKEIEFTESYMDSCTTVALQTALCLGAKEVNVVGYDGYKGKVLSEKEMDLSNENKVIFDDFKKKNVAILRSLTPSLYKSLIVKSIYQYL